MGLPDRAFHFIGVGGIGMSAIAQILVEQGYRVSGSDLGQNRITTKLASKGAVIYQGHRAEQVPEDAVIICSTAIKDTNPEVQRARFLGLPMLHRSDILAELIAQHSRSVAVAGTHGKTTTSSLISFLLLRAGLDPTIVVGGEVSAWQGNARLGRSAVLVAEADESDGTLVKFAPHLGVITNIELDHTDHYQNLEQVVATFEQFAARCALVVASIDCPVVRSRLRPDITYSLQDAQADYGLQQIQYGSQGSSAHVYERGSFLGELHLRVLGHHNLSNALGAIAVCRHLGVPWDTLAAALPEFVGASRRFEIKGTWNHITLVDDYAHHPSEIRVTLAAARLRSPQVVAIFQPHRYSRMHSLLTEFGSAFGDADRVVVTDIYAAGEKNLHGLTGEQVAAVIAEHHTQVCYQPTLTDVQFHLQQTLNPGDLAIFLGAGNLNQAIAPTLAALQELPVVSHPVSAG
jgi:UDP-N-acetylmuramate--alanine ligase